MPQNMSPVNAEHVRCETAKQPSIVFKLLSESQAF